MDVQQFSEIEPEFEARTHRIVWCAVATMDRQGRPRTRILHPIWEGATGWVATGRHSLKERHLVANPYVSLSYWDVQQNQVYADCRAEREDSADENGVSGGSTRARRHLWDTIRALSGRADRRTRTMGCLN